MKIRSLSTLIFVLLVNRCLLQATPHAFICGWTQGSYGNWPGISHQKRPLPIYVRINFDQDGTDEFTNDFFTYLVKILNPSARIKNNKVPKHTLGGFVITVPHSTTRESLQNIIDQANKYFDPEFKTPQELEVLESEKKLQKEYFEKIAADEALKKQLEIERLKKESEKKAEEERRAFAIAQAEKAHKEYLEQKRKEEEEQRRKEQEEPKECNNYRIITLQNDFHIIGKHCLNELGQIAGFINLDHQKSCAAVFEIDGNYRLFPYPGPSKALSINENGEVAIEYTKFMPHEIKQVVLWNIYTNSIVWGPMGSPRDINNNGMVLICNNGQVKIWNMRDNTIDNAKSNGYINNMFLDKYNNYYAGPCDVNKNGTILYSTTTDARLEANNIKAVVTFPECFDFKMALNITNEVAAIVYKRDFNKNITRVEDRIAIWKKGVPITYSKLFKYIAELKYIADLQEPSNLEIIGFNKVGQILLSQGAINRHLFLLIPKN